MIIDYKTYKKTVFRQVTLETGDITSGSDTVLIQCTNTPQTYNDFIFVIQVKTESGTIKSTAITALYNKATGNIEVTDSADELAENDVIIVQGTLV